MTTSGHDVKMLYILMNVDTVISHDLPYSFPLKIIIKILQRHDNTNSHESCHDLHVLFTTDELHI